MFQFQETFCLKCLLIIHLSLNSQGFGQHGQCTWQGQDGGLSWLTQCVVGPGEDPTSAAGVSGSGGAREVAAPWGT